VPLEALMGLGTDDFFVNEAELDEPCACCGADVGDGQACAERVRAEYEP
jgi:hypothetical protein